MNLSKTVLRRLLLPVILAGVTLSLTLFLGIVPQIINLPDGQVQSSGLRFENAVALPKQEQTRSLLGPEDPSGHRTAGLPMRLKIPRIKVDSAVEYVGLTPDGAVGAPKDSVRVAWFNLGPRPGENGSAVITGHYGRKNRKGSVFDNLYKLRKGDQLYIEDEKGVIITFVVRESRRYDPKADAPDVFGSSDGRAHLNLVTCEGAWDRVSKSYSKRLVVFTDKEEDIHLRPILQSNIQISPFQARIWRKEEEFRYI